MNELSSPNQEQADFWSSETGAKWVNEERLMDATLAPVLDRLLIAASPQPGETLLDVGCGTGASTLAAAGIVGPKGHVTGVDISNVMLGRARERANEAGVANAEFVDADAQVFPFTPDSYDAVISRFGVMFFADPVVAFANIAKGLKLGGRIAFLAWAGLAKNPLFAIPLAASVDRLGAPAPIDPREPGPMAFAERDYVTGILSDAGLCDVVAEEVMLDLTPLGSVEQVAQSVTRLGPAARILLEKDGTEADAAAITKTVEEKLRSFVSPDGLRVPATLNLVTACRN